MKKIQFLSLLAGLLFGSMSFMACSSSDDSTNDNGGWNYTPTPKFSGDPSEMKFAAISGVVQNMYGEPMSGVTVTSGTKTTTTNLTGFYQFDQVNVKNGNALVSFSKEGFASVVRAAAFESGKSVRLDAAMTPIEKVTNFTASEGEMMNLNDVSVDLPDGYVDSNGDPYTGTVVAKAVYLDPDNSSFAQEMPGNLIAIRSEGNGGGEVQLVSYGMVNVELTTPDGKPLQLAGNKFATICFDIPQKFIDMENEDPEYTLPEEIPLWSFNEKTGLWEEGEMAKLSSGRTYYEGKVSHFSWVNLDSPELTAHLKVTVQDKNGNKLANVPIDIDGQRTFYTDAKGFMKCDIPAMTKLYVRVASEAYGDYAQFDPTLEFKEYIRVDGNKTKEMTITINSNAPRIYGTVTNTGGSNVCSLYISYGWGSVTSPVISDVDGNFSLFGPADFMGSAVLIARFADGSLVQKGFVISTNDDIRIDLTTETASGAGTGMFRVTNDKYGLNLTYALPAPQEGGLWPATITDGILIISGYNELAERNKEDEPMPEGLSDEEKWRWEEAHHHHGGGGQEVFELRVPGYSTDKTEYDNVDFSYHVYDGPHFSLDIKSVKATITLNNGIYNIKMKGVSGSFSDQMSGIEDNTTVKADVEFSAKKAK